MSQYNLMQNNVTYGKHISLSTNNKMLYKPFNKHLFIVKFYMMFIIYKHYLDGHYEDATDVCKSSQLHTKKVIKHLIGSQVYITTN